MKARIPFDTVLQFFENHGCKLVGFYQRRHVFDDPDNPESTALVVYVDDDRTVDKDEFDRIKKFF